LASVPVSTQRSLCIVMVCTDLYEAEQVGRQLSQLNTGCLVTYRRTQDLLCNAPAGKIALVILATNSDASIIKRTLGWLRRRWPRCSIAVVGDIGGSENELAAREGGAFYLTRPVPPEQWSAVLSHVLTRHARIDVMREKL